ncbi:MAG: hypothetical protein RIC55_23080 [Pirellulaceae bacterium]
MRCNASQMSGFVSGGHGRAHAAAAPRIRAEVRREFTHQGATASLLQRIRLWWRIEREIRRRIQATAPSDALY